jgi:hypothetical protein
VSVHLHIERLIVDEWPDADRDAVGEGLASELTHVVRRHGLEVADGRALAQVAGTFEPTPAPHAAAFGRQIAHAVYGGLSANLGTPADPPLGPTRGRER